jgi:hypothetical protein
MPGVVEVPLREEPFDDKDERAERGHLGQIVVHDLNRARPINVVDPDVDVDRACAAVSVCAGEDEFNGPYSGRLLNVNIGTRARWLTCTSQVSRAALRIVDSWKSGRFFSVGGITSPVIIAISMSLRGVSKSGSSKRNIS